MAKYVSEDGHLFEEQIKEREANNETYNFLREHGTPENNYYRWLVFTYGQGDSTKSWRTEPFPITFGGEFWVPPGQEHWQAGKQKISNFSDEPICPQKDKSVAVSGGQPLSDRAREDLEDMLRDLTRDRKHICDVMVWCLDHSDSAIEILLSDILHNSSCARPSAWAFRAAFESRLPLVFKHLNEIYRKISGRFTAEQAKRTFMNVLRVWEGWGVYSPQFTKGLECSFLCDPSRVIELCKSSIKPWRSSSECVTVTSDDGTRASDSDIGARADGELLPYFDDMAQYPVWLRSTVNTWMRSEVSQLERETRQKGLCVPERAHAVDTIHVYKSKLIQTLAGYEVYYQEKACEEAKNLSSFLVQDLVIPNSGVAQQEEPIFKADNYLTDAQPPISDIIVDEPRAPEKAQSSSKTTVRNMDDSASESSEDLFQERPENEGPLLSDAEESDRDNDIFADTAEAKPDSATHEASPRVKETPQDRLKRDKLRQVELEVTKLQDSLEKQGVADKDLINLQCDQKRQELLAKVERELIRELSDDQRNAGALGGDNRTRSLSPSDKKRSSRKRGRVR